MKVKTRIKQTGVHYNDNMKPYYQIEEYCPNCGNSLGLREGEVDKEKKGKPK